MAAKRKKPASKHSKWADRALHEYKHKPVKKKKNRTGKAFKKR